MNFYVNLELFCNKWSIVTSLVLFKLAQNFWQFFGHLHLRKVFPGLAVHVSCIPAHDPVAVKVRVATKASDRTEFGPFIASVTNHMVNHGFSFLFGQVDEIFWTNLQVIFDVWKMCNGIDVAPMRHLENAVSLKRVRLCKFMHLLNSVLYHITWAANHTFFAFWKHPHHFVLDDGVDGYCLNYFHAIKREPIFCCILWIILFHLVEITPGFYPVQVLHWVLLDPREPRQKLY